MGGGKLFFFLLLFVFCFTVSMIAPATGEKEKPGSWKKRSM